MKDERGIYYYPTMQNRNARMYVRDNAGEVEFRLWSAENPDIWEGHGWVPFEAIRQAAAQYLAQGRERNPLGMYDLDVARRLLADEG